MYAIVASSNIAILVDIRSVASLHLVIGVSSANEVVAAKRRKHRWWQQKGVGFDRWWILKQLFGGGGWR